MAQFQSAIAEVCQMSGIARRGVEVIPAETGIDMSRFPSVEHLCSWAGGLRPRTSAARRGKNRAAMAHSMLIAICHVPKESVPLRNLGADYYDGFRREHEIQSYLKRPQALGWKPKFSSITTRNARCSLPARKSAAGSSAAP